MSEKIAAILKAAVTLWTAEAAEQLKGHSEQMAELKQAMEGNNGDVRIAYCVRRNAIILETRIGNTFAELYCEQLVPDDGFAWPENVTEQ